MFYDKNCDVCGCTFSPISKNQISCSANCRMIKKNKSLAEKWANPDLEAIKRRREGFRRYNINNSIFKNSQDEQIYKIRKKESKSEPIR